MAISTEVIRKITIQGSTQGVDQATAALKGLADAQGNVAVVADSSSKRALSAEAAYNRQTLSVVAGARSQADYEKALKTAKSALDQGIISTTEHAQRVDLLKDKYGQVSAATKAFGVVTSGVSAQLIALSAGAGPVGTFLAALGPWGLGAAIGLGALEKAFNAASDGAHHLAEKAQELRRFSEVTGLTTIQVQALRSEASKFGVTSDEAQTAIQQFTARFNDLRIGQGELLAQIRRVNPALAEQMQMTTNVGDALTLFAQGLAKVDDVFQRNALVKAATGRGGIGAAEFLKSLNVDALTESYIRAGKGLDDGLIKKIAQLEIDIKKTSAASSAALASIFSEQVLEAELKYQKSWLEFATSVKNFSISGDLRYLLETVLKIKIGGSGTFLGDVAGINIEKGYRAPSRSGSSSTDETGFAFYRSTGPADQGDVGRRETNKTLEAQAEAIKKLNDVLGSATTFTQTYNAALADLKVKAKDAGVSQDSLTFGLAKAALDLDLASKQTAALNGILGVAATVADTYRARLQQIAKAQQEGAGASPAQIENAKRLAQAQADGSFQLQAQIDATKLQTSTMGMSIAKAEEFSLIQAKINENLNAGRPALDGVTDAYRKLAAAAGAAKEAQEKAGINQQIGRDRKLALLSPEDVQIANQLKGIYKDIPEALNSAEASAIRFNNALAQGRADAVEFTQGLVKGLMDGKSFMDSLSNSLKNLSTKLADRAIVDLLSGNFEKAAIAGISAAVTYVGSMLTGNKGEEHKRQIDAMDRAAALLTRRIAATMDQGSLQDQLSQFDHNANLQRIEEIRAGGLEMADLERTLSAERAKVIADFNAQAVENEKAAAEARLAAQEEINKRIQSAQDRLFGARNDTSTLEGQLAAFDRQAQREREAEIKDGGQALVDLEAAQAAERYNVIKNYNDKIVADAQATAKQVLDAQTKTAQQIVDYLNNLNAGPESSLSPQDRLAAAQSTFNATSALAAGGNVDAYARVTTDAENLRKAAQDFYASGTGFQAVVASIKSTLTNLPVVSGSADPLVNAMLGVKTAVIATTTAVTTDTTQTSARLDTSINKLDVTADKMSTSVDLLRLIGQQDANVATGWYSRMVDQLVAIATYTKSTADYFSQFSHPTQVAQAPHSDNQWWDPFDWFQQGGVVGAYAPGGIVGNGLFNVDSVRARYAGGGDIALAGGEGIINAQRTRQMGGAAAINMLNRGMMPSAANDNGAHFDQLASRLERAIAAGFVADIATLREENAALRASLARIEKAITGNKPVPMAPGTKTASARG